MTLRCIDFSVIANVSLLSVNMIRKESLELLERNVKNHLLQLRELRAFPRTTEKPEVGAGKVRNERLLWRWGGIEQRKGKHGKNREMFLWWLNRHLHPSIRCRLGATSTDGSGNASQPGETGRSSEYNDFPVILNSKLKELFLNAFIFYLR